MFKHSGVDMFQETRLQALRNLWSILIAVLVICGADQTAYPQQIGVSYSAAAQTESSLKNLSPASQLVMERLSKLDALPVGDLRYFAGNVPNGAAVSLDDSSWQTIQIPFTASSSEMWLRKWVVVPKTFNGYDPTGAKMWLEEPTRAMWRCIAMVSALRETRTWSPSCC